MHYPFGQIVLNLINTSVLFLPLHFPPVRGLFGALRDQPHGADLGGAGDAPGGAENCDATTGDTPLFCCFGCCQKIHRLAPP